MDIVVKAMGWNKRSLGERLSMSPTAAWKNIKGNTVISAKHAKPLSEKSGYNLLWLLTGEGDMKPTTDLLEEPSPTYQPMNRDLINETINKRFDAAIRELMLSKGLSQYQEAAEFLHVNYDHMNAVRGNHKPLSMTLLVQAGKYGGINANYILYGMEPIMLSELASQNNQIAALRKRVDELKKDKDTYQMMLNTLTNNDMKQTG